MTDDDIIDLADKAGSFSMIQYGVTSAKIEWLQKFASLVAERERLATRQWQGLTYEEMCECLQQRVTSRPSLLVRKIAEAIEEKLKEKNNA